MKLLVLTVITLTSICSCTQERIFKSDVEQLLFNQLESNANKLEEIKQEIKALNIEKIKSNELLIRRIENTHRELLQFNDEIDRMQPLDANGEARNFIEKHFKKLRYYRQSSSELTKDTPRPLLKLLLATMEAFYLIEQKDRYSFGETVSFGKIQPVIFPDKIIFDKGEKISGNISLMAMAEADPRTTNFIRKIDVNGQQISPQPDGTGYFEIETRKTGIYTLTAFITLPDTVLRGDTKVYVRD